MGLKNIRSDLRSFSDKTSAEVLQRFFKTGPGDYGEGDKFLGVRVPDIRRLVRKHKAVSFREALPLLKSPFHEERLLALLMMVRDFSEVNEERRSAIYNTYLDNTRYINSWDLVDLSAEHIVGAFLSDKARKPLYNLAASGILWERRISIMSTFHFVKRDEFDETIRIARMLLSDGEDLIHKAVGWMLREIGKRSLRTEEVFLKAHYRGMPRTMLRYAIERFPEVKRQRYLKGRV